MTIDVKEKAYQFIEWSPDGTKLAILGSERGRNVIWIADEESQWEFVQEIVVETLNLDILEWSPDGQMMPYVCGDSGPNCPTSRSYAP